MEARERLQLRKNHSYLIQNVDVSTVVCSLYEKSILTEEDKGRITCENVTEDKVDRLLKIILRKRGAFEPFVNCVDPHIKKKIEDTDIPEDDIRKEEQHLDEFVKDILRNLFLEEEKEKVSVSTLEEEVRQQFIASSTEYRLEKDHLISVVLSTFSTVQLKKSGGRRNRTLVYRNLKWKEKDATSDEDDTSADHETSQTQKRVLVEDMDTHELCEILEEFDTKSNRLDRSILDVFKKEQVDGKIFKHLDLDDTKELLPDLSFRDRKNLLITRDELGQLESTGHLVTPVEVLKTSKPQRPEKRGIFRETFRHFETTVGNHDSYRKSAILRTNVTRPGNLIEPIHLFLHSSSGQNIESWIAKETVRFSSACMNDRTNGTVHFGIECRNQVDFTEGEIIGVRVEESLCRKEIYNAITHHFFGDQIELALKCIRPVEFIEVSNTDNTQPYLVIVEVDVVPHSTLVQDEAVFVQFEEGMFLYRFLNDNPYPKALADEEKREYIQIKKQLSIHRKEQEQRPKLRIPIQEDLRQKFLNLFSGGCETLAEEMYPILFLSPMDVRADIDFKENFQFINDIEPTVIFDFDSTTEERGMYHFVEVESEQVVKVLRTDNFDRNSEENKSNHEHRNHLFDDLRTSALKPWVFCNGYDVMKQDQMTILEWKRNRSEGFKEALRFYGEEIPQGRAMVIFLLFSKNYDVLLEAAEEVILKFHDQWMLLAQDRNLADHWMSELLRRQTIDKKTLAERCIIGLPWNHVNIMLMDIAAIDKSGSCEIPTSKGAYCHLRDKARHEMYDLEILSRKECGDNEIIHDPEKLEKRRMEEQESFFRGGQVTWWNFWFGSDHVLQRSQHTKLMDILNSALDRGQNEEDSRVPIVNLIHQPGAGGTTSARQLLWNMREKYRCCIVKQITDQTCDQIVMLRNYEDPTTPQPPIVLLDNCDEESVENLYAMLENRGRVAARRSETTISCFCVLLMCNRRTNLPSKTDKSIVLLKHELDPHELDWFKKKYESLENKYRNENKGVDPRLLISFNILKENFNQDYIKRTVQQYVDSIESEDEKNLILYLSMMNSYDLDFQSVPISAFDTMMSRNQRVTKRNVFISFGIFSPQRQRQKRQWESSMSSSLKILLNRSSRTGMGTNLQALSIINKLFAREILKFLKTKMSLETSSVMLQFLSCSVFEKQNRSVNQVKKIVKDILKKREEQANGKKEKFSPLLTEIYVEEDPDRAARVLLKGFDMTQDPMIAQQTARLYMDCRNWDEALRFAKIAVQMWPNNSYLWDTYGLVFKQQLQEKYHHCLSEGERFSVDDTKSVIHLARKGIEIFHKEQSVSEQERHASTNDAGYYNEVRLVILLLDLLKVSSTIEKEALHKILIDKNVQFDNVKKFGLDKDTYEYLRCLQRHTDVAMRKLEDKATQLKDSAIKSVFRGESAFSSQTLSKLRENVDNYFGEDSDDVPPNLSDKDKADFRRRRIRRLGGRSLANILALRRDEDGGAKLEAMFNHLLRNVKSENIEAFDIKSFIGVALVLHITKNKCNPYPYKDLMEMSKRLYSLQLEDSDAQPFLEEYLYLVMLHWPTESRRHLNLFPIGKFPEVMRKWKMAFQRNHSRQRDDNNPVRLKRETTYFFLGNGRDYDEIVYYEELHGSHSGKYYKGDTVWLQPEAREKLRRLEGILLNEGANISIEIETAGGNKTQIVVPTGTQIGQRTLWQKRVYFYLGFTWSGPKAFDVQQEERRPALSQKPYSEFPSKHQSGRNAPLQQPDVLQQIINIQSKLKKIDTLKRLPNRSKREENIIKEEKDLRKELDDLIRSRQQLFGTV